MTYVPRRLTRLLVVLLADALDGSVCSLAKMLTYECNWPGNGHGQARNRYHGHLRRVVPLRACPPVQFEGGMLDGVGAWLTITLVDYIHRRHRVRHPAPARRASGLMRTFMAPWLVALKWYENAAS